METTGQISSVMNNLSEVILNSNTTFHIPDFQREFVWTNEEINELFQDFSEDTDDFKKESSELQGYLLGNIVLINDGDKSLVIDGQQRLTTLSLIFKALYEIVRQKANKEIQSPSTQNKWLQRLGGLNKGFQNLDDAEDFVGLKITHEESLPFGKYYRNLIRGFEGEDIKTASDQNIDDVYNAIIENIESFKDDQLMRFIVYLRTKVMLIVTTAPSRSKAFQLFEVLNDRGRSLEPMDLVKNLFLKQLSTAGFGDSDQKEFNSNWTQFINNMQITSKRKISSSTFMKHFIVAEFGKNIKQDKLFDFFDKNSKDSKDIVPANEILQFSRKLVKVSHTYQNIEKNPSENDFSKHPNMFILFKLLSLKQFHPILIPFYDSDQEIKDKVLDAVTRLGAAVIFSYTQTNYIEKTLPAISKQILDKDSVEQKAEIVVQNINQLIEGFTPILETTIATRNFANANGKLQKKAVDMLKFIELYFNNNTAIIKPPQKKKITAEHILPQTISINLEEYGFSSEKQRFEYLNHIGNLTLLYNAENSGIGNSLFSEKAHAYAKSELKITQSIVKNIETSVKAGKEAQWVNRLNEYQPTYLDSSTNLWTKQLIDKRGSDIANLVADLVSKK